MQTVQMVYGSKSNLEQPSNLGNDKYLLNLKSKMQLNSIRLGSNIPDHHYFPRHNSLNVIRDKSDSNSKN